MRQKSYAVKQIVTSKLTALQRFRTGASSWSAAHAGRGKSTWSSPVRSLQIYRGSRARAGCAATSGSGRLRSCRPAGLGARRSPRRSDRADAKYRQHVSIPTIPSTAPMSPIRLPLAVDLARQACRSSDRAATRSLRILRAPPCGFSRLVRTRSAARSASAAGWHSAPAAWSGR